MKKIDELGLQDEMKKVVEYLPLDAKTKNRLVMVCEKPSNRIDVRSSRLKMDWHAGNRTCACADDGGLNAPQR